LKSVGVRMPVHVAFSVRVRTSDAPVCSNEFCAPLFSNPSPVKFWWF
jgi:hypothetical protein